MPMRKPGVDAPPAFRQQLLAAVPRLRRYARSLAFESANADDLVQTALERALAHWHQFDQRRDMAVWLLSIAHNAHLDQRRRDARMTIVDPDEIDEHFKRSQVGNGGQGGNGNDPGLRIDLIDALNHLGAEQRDALLLVSVEQFTYAEAAEVLRIPVGTVMSRVSRARAALRRWLDGGARVGAGAVARAADSAHASASGSASPGATASTEGNPSAHLKRVV